MVGFEVDGGTVVDVVDGGTVVDVVEVDH